MRLEFPSGRQYTLESEISRLITYLSEISKGSEGMDLPVRVRVSRQRPKTFFFVLYIGCLHKVWPRLKVDHFTSKILD